MDGLRGIRIWEGEGGGWRAVRGCEGFATQIQRSHAVSSPAIRSSDLCSPLAGTARMACMVRDRGLLRTYCKTATPTTTTTKTTTATTTDAKPTLPPPKRVSMANNWT